MTSYRHVTRRRFLGAASCLAAATLAGCASAGAIDRQLALPTFAAALAELDRLVAARALDHDGAFNWAQTLTHCAQSIEYSMSGYPQAKSALFQHTAGALAFSFFAARGRMSHKLDEAIPGAPDIDAASDLVIAQARLRQAVSDFQASDKPLHPHFAYGALSKAEYEQAHAMHLANHFSSFAIKA
jgi:hypothetical protein